MVGNTKVENSQGRVGGGFDLNLRLARDPELDLREPPIVGVDRPREARHQVTGGIASWPCRHDFPVNWPAQRS
jgi:hypothetical protein